MSLAVAIRETSAPALVTGLGLLRQPFPAHQISKLPKPKSKDAQKGRCAECGGWHGLPAVHLDYVGHAALTDRLLDADPAWTWEPIADAVALGLPTAQGGMWIRLTVCGVSRLGFGHSDGKSGGDAVKEVIGDALRNAAMRFGAALDLWHKGQLHVDEDAADERSAPTAPQQHAVAKPEGYDAWLQSMRATAAKGSDALRAEWKSSPLACRTFLTSSSPELIEQLRATATNAEIDREIDRAGSEASR